MTLASFPLWPPTASQLGQSANTLFIIMAAVTFNHLFPSDDFTLPG